MANADANGGFIFQENGGSSIAEFRSDTNQTYWRGNMGIQKTITRAPLDVLGIMSGSALTISNVRACDTIDSNGIGVFACGTDATSDERLKENVEPLQNGALDFLNGVRTVTFDWNDEMLAHYPQAADDGRQLGFIAQDFAVAYPELVEQDEFGYYRLKYDHAGPVIVKALQELDDKVEALEERLAKLEKSGVGFCHDPS